eukprot:PhM_4_TR14712/c0_g1_i1/m.63183
MSHSRHSYRRGDRSFHSSSAVFFITAFGFLILGLSSRTSTGAAALRVTPLSATLNTNGNACESDGAINSGQFSTTSQDMATFNGNVYFLTTNTNKKKNRLRYYSPSTQMFETALGSSSCNSDAGLVSPSGLHTFDNNLYIMNTGKHTIVKVSASHAMTTWLGVEGSAGNSVDVVAGTSAKLSSPTRMTHLASSLYFSQSSSTSAFEIMRVAATTQMLSLVVALINTPVSLTVLRGKMLFATEVVGSPSAVLQSI